MRLPDGVIVRYRFPWWLRPFLLRGVVGITLGRRIYVEGDDPVRTLRHELVHMQQIARLGLLCFYWRWIREYLGQRFRGASADQAYRRISFEIEAFAAEREETL
ncbi:MAG: hypothetical protein DMF59_20245 [Acidobacteria bacterium]|nr:MAG: hypothetical protein DMF59_20245 [Acidobacteriota bacterium]